ncbi:MLO-like protein 4 isoform X2 [Macadamia integrifolia]|uniref:MLO-like protein 4 isoform X2 n=1 Tax=Macadamia integrifolia TaxID=60698 RepID=UPI001C4EA9D0|nr:MLO-like protein 4 isoform X2 [Macadamia integrifolia]
MEKERSLSDSPSWAVAIVITVMVTVCFFVSNSLKWFGKWLDTTKKKALLSALEKIKDELMLFGLLSLLMSHWTFWVAKICVKHSALSSRFYPCPEKEYSGEAKLLKHILIGSIHSLNHSVIQKQEKIHGHDYCPEGLEPFASYESLEQLHRLLFVLAVTHVSYSFITIALAMLKINSWRKWENEAKSMANESRGITTGNSGILCMSTVIFHHTSHPWSKHKYRIWMLCFFRQFWTSINKSEYMALRLGFLGNHRLHMSYDFHSYMLRSMEDEFRDIVGISVPLWVYAILCIFLDFHGAVSYFWLSFTPVIFILLVGTKMHHIVVKLAIEITDATPCFGSPFNLTDELFWFGRPEFMLQVIQLILFQTAFEMATFLWSLWEIREPSCFMDNRVHLVIRLTSGVIFQSWCSYVALPLYVIITQMGSRFRKTVVSEDVRISLHGWSTRVKEKLSQNRSPSIVSTRSTMSTRSTTSSNSVLDANDETALISRAGSSKRIRKI